MTDPHHHAVLLYDDADELRAAVADRADGELVVLACRPEHNRLLAAACPGALLQPRPETFRRPVAVLAAVRRLLRHPDRRPGAPVRYVAEPDHGTTAGDWARAATYDAACDVALAGEPMTTVSAYPRAGTPAEVLSGRVHTTPDGDAPRPDPGVPPVRLLSGSRDRYDIGPVRARAAEALAGLPTLIRTDFVAALNEVLTNAYLHGRPPVDVTVWLTADRVEGRVTDRGPGFDDPLAGYRPGSGGTRTGSGLWLARQACDDVDAWPAPEGFTVRLATAIAPELARQTYGAIARAEVAQARVDFRQVRSRPR
ncbi:ATP-binding protein [Dactylosporangium sp. McL0621]|uniref:ATP-binding protein n=1 Tax=Dactylosporangium sp. McL0621 TaxID=3415678 RepID=UPI003CE9E805